MFVGRRDLLINDSPDPRQLPQRATKHRDSSASRPALLRKKEKKEKEKASATPHAILYSWNWPSTLRAALH